VPTPSPLATPSVWSLLAVGVVGGFFAGVFGVGGGFVMVPLLLWWTSMGHKRAHASSLFAITPIAIVGAVSYGVGGVFEWLPAIFVATGGIIGAQIGAWILRAIRVGILRWAFIAFTLVSATALLFQLPDRSSNPEVSVMTATLLVGLGLAMGIAAGLFGVGGGVVVIPVLVVFAGYSDLAAKSVSLLAMAPGAISGSISHLRHKTASLRDGLWMALGAIMITPLGATLAFLLSPRLASVLFALLLFFVAANLIVQAFRKGHKD
jgi:uncharacterized protein